MLFLGQTTYLHSMMMPTFFAHYPSVSFAGRHHEKLSINHNPQVESFLLDLKGVGHGGVGGLCHSIG